VHICLRPPALLRPPPGLYIYIYNILWCARLPAPTGSTAPAAGCSLSLSIYLSIYLYLSIHLSVYRSIYLSMSISISRRTHTHTPRVSACAHRPVGPPPHALSLGCCRCTCIYIEGESMRVERETVHAQLSFYIYMYICMSDKCI
jgi:hypothetical protein